VRLLFDNNLAPRLVTDLADLYASSLHVSSLGLSIPDDEVWHYARIHERVIVSKDSGFHQRSLLYGHPPKVVWIRRGNCSTRTIAALLRDHFEEIVRFVADERAAFLVLK